MRIKGFAHGYCNILSTVCKICLLLVLPFFSRKKNVSFFSPFHYIHGQDKIDSSSSRGITFKECNLHCLLFVDDIALFSSNKSDLQYNHMKMMMMIMMMSYSNFHPGIQECNNKPIKCY